MELERWIVLEVGANEAVLFFGFGIEPSIASVRGCRIMIVVAPLRLSDEVSSFHTMSRRGTR